MGKAKPKLIHLSGRHQYPTRWKLRRNAFHQSSIPPVSRADDKAKDQAFVPCKRRKEDGHILYLPREIIFNILLQVPCEVLQNAVKYVCKQWFEIIRDPDFVRVHLQIHPLRFLFQPRWTSNHVYYIKKDAANLKVTIVKIPAPAKILCCYKGLLLLSDSTNTELFHVMNPATKVKISLPPLVSSLRFQSMGLAVDSSGHYKVVHVSGEIESVIQVQMRVFTIDVDKAWRLIDFQGIPDQSAPHYFRSMLDCQHCYGGFLYWLTNCNWKSYLGLALDVNTETIYQFSKPNFVCYGYHPGCVIGMGSGIGMIYRNKQFKWKLWKLTDVKSNEWTELACIDMWELYTQFELRVQFSYMLRPGYLSEIAPVRLFRGDLWFYGYLEKKFVVVRYNIANQSFEIFPFNKEQLRSSDPSSSSEHMIFTQELLGSPSIRGEDTKGFGLKIRYS